MNNHGLPDSAVSDILAFANGLPTVVRGAIVAPNDAGGLRVVSIDKACEVIRQRSHPLTFDCPNSLDMVMRLGNRYQF